MRPKPDSSKGILGPRLSGERFQLFRFEPSSDLAPFVEHHWGVRWDLRGQPPHRQETLPFPSVHLVCEQSDEGTEARVVGVVKGKFARVLRGRGQVLGVKFRPGGFYPFFRSSVASLTDRTVELFRALGADGAALARSVFSADEPAAQASLAEAFLRERLPAPDPVVRQVQRAVDCVASDLSVLRVDDLAERLATPTRTLQKIFKQYVGVSPKWVIQRCRLHEAAEQIAGGSAEWAELAVRLGYFDQAHFIKDFKTIVGRTPADYARAARQAD